LIEALKIYKSYKIDQAKVFNDIDYAIKLLSLFSMDSTYKTLYMKDGLVFSHLESLYERHLNTLVLHWRDPLISMYYGNSDNINGFGGEFITTVLRLTDSYDFITLEEDTLRLSMFA
jgi:hypothetical protein